MVWIKYTDKQSNKETAWYKDTTSSIAHSINSVCDKRQHLTVWGRESNQKSAAAALAISHRLSCIHVHELKVIAREMSTGPTSIYKLSLHSAY